MTLINTEVAIAPNAASLPESAMVTLLEMKYDPSLAVKILNMKSVTTTRSTTVGEAMKMRRMAPR